MTEDQSDDHQSLRPHEPLKTEVTTLQEAVDDIGIDRAAWNALAETDDPLAPWAEAILERTE